MAEVAAARVAFRVPIVRELDLAAFVARNAEENEGEAARFIVHPPPLFEAEELEEADGGVRIADPKHRMKEAHGRYLVFGACCVTVAGAGSSASASLAALPTGPPGSPAAARCQ